MRDGERGMNDRSRRRELRDQYQETRAEAGVYRIINWETGRALLGSSPNLPSIRNKIAFARSTGSAGVFDHRLRADVAKYGIDAFDLEILEVLETTPEMTRDDILRDLATLESIWREEQNPETLY